MAGKEEEEGREQSEKEVEVCGRRDSFEMKSFYLITPHHTSSPVPPLTTYCYILSHHTIRHYLSPHHIYSTVPYYTMLHHNSPLRTTVHLTHHNFPRPRQICLHHNTHHHIPHLTTSNNLSLHHSSPHLTTSPYHNRPHHSSTHRTPFTSPHYTI